jgi:MFS family permease
MGRLFARLRASVRVFATLGRNRDLRRVQLAFLGFNAVEYGTWIAILLYAYHATGPVSVGVVALVQLIPASFFAPAAAMLGDRMRRERFLLLGYGVETVTMALVTVAMLLELHPVVVYTLACVETAALTMSRPAQGALLPSLAHTPDELTASNGLSAVFQGAGVLVGPLGAAAILAFSTPAAVFVGGTMTLAIATLLSATVRVRPAEPAARGDAPAASGAVWEGLRVLVRRREPRLLVSLQSAQMILSGALDVLFVLMALQLFHTGSAGAGVLNAALWAGGMIGGAATLALVGHRRLGPSLVVGAFAFGVPFALIALAPSDLTGTGLIAASAIGLALMDATGRTLLQRVVSDETLARVFGLLEGLGMAALAVGSILVSPLKRVAGAPGDHRDGRRAAPGSGHPVHPGAPADRRHVGRPRAGDRPPGEGADVRTTSPTGPGVGGQAVPLDGPSRRLGPDRRGRPGRSVLRPGLRETGGDAGRSARRLTR